MRQQIKAVLTLKPASVREIANALRTTQQAAIYHLKRNPQMFEVDSKVPPANKGKWVTIWRLRHAAG